MTSSKPNPPSSGSRKAAPPPRRSARQQRMANRAANRELARAGTRGGGGGDMRTLALWTLAAVVIGVAVIGGAWWLTQPKSANVPNLMPPAVLTPSDIASSGRTLGAANAPVTIDLYSDFQCPNCQAFSFEVEPQIVSNYVKSGKVKIVYKDYLVIDLGTGGTESKDAANASLCAADQGKFWLFHDWLFANQLTEGSGVAFTKDRLKKMGGFINGLNTTTFDKCVDEGQHYAAIQADAAKIPQAVKDQGTPSLVINGKIAASYAWPTVKAAIEAALNPSTSPSPSAGATPTAAPTASPS